MEHSIVMMTWVDLSPGQLLRAAPGRRGLIQTLIVGAALAAVFVTRPRVEVSGRSLLLENLAALLLAIAVLADPSWRGRAREVLRETPVRLLAAFIAYSGFISVLRSPDPWSSLAIVTWLALNLVLTVALASWFGDRVALERAAVVGSSIAAAVAVIMWLGHVALGTDVGVRSGDQFAVAVYGLSWEANILGSVSACLAFLAFTAKSTRSTRWGAIAIVLLLAATLLSETRAAVAGLGLGLVLYAVGRHVSVLRRHAVALFAVTAALIVLALVSVTVFARSLIDEFRARSGTGAYRLDSWVATLDDLDPLGWILGSGVNTFPRRGAGDSLGDRESPEFNANLALQVLHDTGLVGVTLLVVVCALLIGRASDRIRALSFVVVYGFCALFTSPFWFAVTWLFVALALCRPTIGLERRLDPASAERPRERQ